MSKKKFQKVVQVIKDFCDDELDNTRHGSALKATALMMTMYDDNVDTDETLAESFINDALALWSVWMEMQQVKKTLYEAGIIGINDQEQLQAPQATNSQDSGLSDTIRSFMDSLPPGDDPDDGGLIN